MNERYPWEEESQEGLERPRPEPADALPAQIELVPSPSGAAPAPQVREGPPPEATQSVQPPRPAPEAARHAPPPPPARPPGEQPRPPLRERPVARKEYYSIGEVSELAGLPAHVLRYWESQFSVLNPSKNRSGNRAYQRKEIKLILLVKHLLYEEKYTVEGAKAKLDQLRRGGLLAEHTARALDAQTLALLREDVTRLRELLGSG